MTHGLETLKLLYDHDDFMSSLKTVADMGAGVGQDSIWWATRTTRDDEPRPLNIKVYSVDHKWEGIERLTHKNVTWITKDFSETGIAKESIDLIWAHDCLQYSKDPLKTLAHWNSLLSEDAMLCLEIPYNHEIISHAHDQRIDTVVYPGCYFNYTPANLILLLASSGFDCRGGHFRFHPTLGWIQAAVYKIAEPQVLMDWYGLLDKKLLPPSAENAIHKTGKLRDSDLLVEWIDHAVYGIGRK